MTNTERYWKGFMAYVQQRPLDECRDAEQIRGWLAALHAEADSQTDDWLVEHRTVVVEIDESSSVTGFGQGVEKKE